jgi:ABC-type nitrate/sulfonate/bicarbonate transport system substrate-binding protein
LSQPADIEFKRRGYPILGTSHDVIPTLQFTVIAARRAWATQNKDLVVRFAKAMGAAYEFMRDPANRAEVLSIAATSTGSTPDVTGEIYRLYYEPDRGVMPKHAEISMEGVAEVIRLLGVAGELKAPLPPAERFVDLQFLQAAGMN